MPARRIVPEASGEASRAKAAISRSEMTSIGVEVDAVLPGDAAWRCRAPSRRTTIHELAQTNS